MSCLNLTFGIGIELLQGQHFLLMMLQLKHYFSFVDIDLNFGIETVACKKNLSLVIFDLALKILTPTFSSCPCL